MTELKPFLTKFARKPDSPSVSYRDTRSDLERQQGEEASKAITPRPTTHTLVNAETTDEN